MQDFLTKTTSARIQQLPYLITDHHQDDNQSKVIIDKAQSAVARSTIALA